MRRILLLLLALTFLSGCAAKTDAPQIMPPVEYQMQLGPRTPGSEAHDAFVSWACGILKDAGWETEAEEKTYRGKTVRNIIAERPAGTAGGKRILIGAHYDSRINADQESTELKWTACPGAEDGASGVAILLALAQTLPELSDKNILLVFFDAEDQGGIMGWPDWCLGSQLLAQEYAAAGSLPDEVIILDMVGDRDLNIYREQNSDPKLTDTLFSIAAELGLANQFINEEKYRMTDDHVPFAELGVPAVDLIDFDYPYWHTVSDTADKLSEESLNAVYRVIYTYLTGE